MPSLYLPPGPPSSFVFFFFNDTATTEIYTLSLHDALPICAVVFDGPEDYHARIDDPALAIDERTLLFIRGADRKSTRLNSSHGYISYAVFCLKKKTMPLVKRLWRDEHIPTNRGWNHARQLT